MTQSEQKTLVANTAIDTLIEKGKIFSGMKIGLGTGSTAMPAVKRLAEHINSGKLKDIKAVVTSFQTQNACQEYGIPVYSLNDKIIYMFYYTIYIGVYCSLVFSTILLSYLSPTDLSGINLLFLMSCILLFIASII